MILLLLCGFDFKHMKKTITYSLGIVVCLLAFSCNNSQPNKDDLTTITVEYSPTNAKFPNPERGFYKHTRIDLTTGSGALTQSQFTSWRQNNITLSMRMFYLKKFKDKPLSQAALDEIEADFATTRKAGGKLIVRFAYSEAQTEADAPLAIIQQHLDQLKPVLERNADVIVTVQAGLIGAWGEWYYSSNGLNNTASRNQVLKKLLETVPANRTVQVRTPQYKQQYFQNSTPMSYTVAFNGSDISRVGFHNDCFLASDTDYGTYTNPDTDKAYLNKECLFVPIGGETCPPSGISPASSIKAQNDMRYLRWTYLNEDYYRGVNDLWIGQGGMDNIIREMGYRLQLLSGGYTNKTAPKGWFSAKITIKNTGYAPLFNPRLVELVLINKTTKEQFKVNVDVEPRFWQPLANNEFDVTAGLKNVPEGNYDLFLHLPDPEPTLYGNPAYSIRLANDNVWDAATGYNNLNAEIEIASSNNVETYSGGLFFEKAEN